MKISDLPQPVTVAKCDWFAEVSIYLVTRITKKGERLTQWRQVNLGQAFFLWGLVDGYQPKTRKKPNDFNDNWRKARDYHPTFSGPSPRSTPWARKVAVEYLPFGKTGYRDAAL